MLLYTETRTIHAPAEVVYDIIADLAQYAQWNPWIAQAEGGIEAGDAITVHARLANRLAKFEHKMISSQRPTLFHWCDLGWFTHFAYGERIRHITPIDEQHCTYHVELKVTGIGAGLAGLMFGSFMKNGLNNEANAIAQRAVELIQSPA